MGCGAPRDRPTTNTQFCNPHSTMSYKFAPMEGTPDNRLQWHSNFRHRIKKKMCLRCVASWKGRRRPFSPHFLYGTPYKMASPNPVLLAHFLTLKSSNFTCFSTCSAKKHFFGPKGDFWQWCEKWACTARFLVCPKKEKKPL